MNMPWQDGDTAFLRYTTSDTGITTDYIATAPRGSLPTEAVWRCSRIMRKTFSDFIETERITHCVDLQAPGETGENMIDFTYV